MAHFDIEFPVWLAESLTGGPEFSTTVVTGASGREKRNINWPVPRRRYRLDDVNLSSVGSAPETAETLLALSMVLSGSGHTMLLRDRHDYRVSPAEACEQIDATHWRLRKAYSYGGQTVYRRITRPKSGTVQVYEGGVLQTSGYTLDGATGILTFGSAKSAVTAAFEFWVRVRLAGDAVQLEYLPARQASIASLELLEVLD